MHKALPFPSTLSVDTFTSTDAIQARAAEAVTGVDLNGGAYAACTRENSYHLYAVVSHHGKFEISERSRKSAQE